MVAVHDEYIDDAGMLEAEKLLPRLIGTAKQVAWASSIRLRLFQLAWLRNETAEDLWKVRSARWWIDHRMRSLRDLSDDAALEVEEALF